MIDVFHDRGLWCHRSVAADQNGLWRLSDESLTTLVAVGNLDPLEMGDVRATPAKLQNVVTANGGGILWLEVTGVFYLLPVLVFTPTLWRTRSSFAHGPDHRTFVASAIVIVIFFYLGVSSFWRARRK